MTDHEKLRILVIDDEVTQRMLVKDYLEEAGHVVRQAEDGRRGLKMASVTKPDVILLDVLLPVMDGYSVCRKFKEAPETSDTPVILITASREADVIERGLAAGADDFVTKPVDWAFLSDRVVNVVRIARERADMARQLRKQTGVGHEAAIAPRAISEAHLDEFMRSAELQVSQADEVAARERQRLESQHAEALESAVAHAKAAKDAEFAAIRSRHDAELRAMRLRCDRDIESIHAAARQDLTAAENRCAAELDTMRRALDSATAGAEARLATVVNDASATSSTDRVDAAWSLALRWANAQSTIAASLAAEAKLAQAGDSAAQMQNMERSARAIASAAAKLKIVAQAMAAPAEQTARPVNAASLLADIAAQADVVARQRRVEVRRGFSDNAAMLNVDVDKLRYSLLSLVSNALRFTPPGGAIDLKLSTGETGEVRIDIVDAGVGISPSKLQSLRDCLDAPSRLGDSEDAAAGLGIPAAMALVRQMGGRLELESQLGAGTRASLAFPAAQHQSQQRSRSMQFAG